MKYLKVMFGTNSAADSNVKYKLNEVNVATNWNINASNPKEMGGFNFSNEENILRWLHRGNTIYDVEVPADAEIVKVIKCATPNGVFRSNKIIIKNPRKVTDKMALELYKKSNIPEIAYYKALAAVCVMGYEKTALQIFKDKVNKDNIKIVLNEWNDFIKKMKKKNVIK